VLSVAAGILGVALAAVATPALLSLAPDALPRAESIQLDHGVLGFALAISLASGVLFGLVPAVSASDLDLEGTLRGSASMRPGSRWIRRVLVTADVGLALVLLCAASLLLRSFVHALGVDPGFRADGVTTFKVVVPSPSTAPPEASADRFRSHSERALVALRALPGVESAGAISMLPLGGDNSDRLFTVEGETDGPTTELKSEQYRLISPGFFETLRIPLLQGRRIEATDGVGAPAVVVVNESFARKYFPGGDVLGKRIHLTSPASDWTAIVGIVGDVREFGLDEPVEPIMYFPQAQRPSEALSYVVRSTLPFAQMSRTAAAAIEGVDAQVPTFSITPYESLLSASVAQRRFSLALVATFALLALVLAAVGLYGVVAYSVRQRTKEIGVRMAIGADSARIARLVASESARMVGIGLVLGLGGALVVARLLASFLYGVGPADPLALAGAGLVLAAAAALATLFPVRRATRVDPVIALAAE
jgi:putative ABC transport system permease protein